MRNEMAAKNHKKHGKWHVFSDFDESLRNSFKKHYEDHCKDNPNPQSLEKFLNDREILYYGEPIVEESPKKSCVDI